MSKPKHEILEITKDGKIVKDLARENAGFTIYQEIIKEEFDEVNFLSPNIFTHSMNGKTVKSLLLRITGTGVLNAFARKRAQVSGKWITSLPDDIICVYEYKGNRIFIRSTNPKTLESMPENITNLFFTNAADLRKAFDETFCIKDKVSRRIKTDLIFSKYSHKLYDHGVNSLMESDENAMDLNDFDFVEEDNYQTNAEVENASEIGRIGEEIVAKLIKNDDERLSSIQNIKKYKWVNEIKEMHLPFDFSYDDFVLEVKSSTGKNNKSFCLSENEKLKLIDNPKKYMLIKVNGVDIRNSNFYNIKLYTGKEVLMMDFDTLKTFVYKENENEE